MLFFLLFQPFACHSGLFLTCRFSLFFLSVTPAYFFICHSGLRAGVQVNVDSLITWIPGQARNDSYMSVMAYSTLGRESAHYKQRASMAPKPK